MAEGLFKLYMYFTLHFGVLSNFSPYKKKFVVRQKASSEKGMREKERERERERGGEWPGSRETSSKTNWLEGPH